MGNVLSPVSGTIIVVEADEEDSEPTRRSGPRFPRASLERVETNRRFAHGSTPPPMRDDREVIDFDDAVTEVNTPRPTPVERPSTAS